MEDTISAIHRALECVEERLQSDLTVADMAVAAGYSLFHFARTFNRLVRHTPYDYLMRRRLSEAALAVVNSDARILDIALAYRFHSPEVFTRAFKRMFGVLPTEGRALGRLDPRRLFPARRRAHLELFARAEFLPPARVTLPELRLAGLTSCLSTGASQGDEVWAMLAHQLEWTAYARPRVFYGVRLYPRGWEAGGPMHMAGVQLEPGQTAEAPLVTLVIHACPYAVFRLPPACSPELIRDYFYGAWLHRAGIREVCALEIECFNPEMPGLPSFAAPLERLLFPLPAETPE